jgi:formylglycine-generating enzyme required for sulfatase activity
MSEKTAQTLQELPSERTTESSRLLPFAVAVVVCSVLAFALGYGSWYFFGSHNRLRIEAAIEAENAQIETTGAAPAEDKQTETAAPNPPAEPPAQTSAAPPVEGVVKVEGGEVVTGGGESNRPVKRTMVEDFSIAETEVTNAQYAEFIRETGHRPPAGWNKDVFPKGTDDYPVVNVSWQDAEAFCRWLGQKLGMNVRLPSEAEWELAARGREQFKYPWGNEWNKEAAVSEETGGAISAVKSRPLNRSPFGAYDMAGNVWEWTRDEVTSEESLTDEELKKLLERGQTLRVVKGGTAKDPARQISALARYEMPETTQHPHIGFRYVITPR